MIYQSNMCHIFNIVLIFTYLSTALAIRVDWNTNHGPIIPPTSTLPPVPKPPFRDPAPVWEDQSNDIPNPNPYLYVAPPPSRPRYNPDYFNYNFGFPQYNLPQQQQQQQHYQQSQYQHQYQLPQQQGSPASTSSTTTTTTTTTPPPPSTSTLATGSSSTTTTTTTTTLRPQTLQFGTVVNQHPNQINDNDNQKTTIVSSLATKYIPNFGNKYIAIVPQKSQFLTNNDVYDKYNGKYNPKLKKYKAYEQKAKMVPFVMYYVPKHQYVYYNNYPAKSDVSKH